MKTIKKTIGRATTVLVFDADKKPFAITTDLIARRIDGRDGDIAFAGPVRFHSDSEHRIRTIVFPLVLEVAERLGLHTPAVELSGVNLSAASCREVGVEIQGSSGDCAAFLVLLSLVTSVPVRQDIVVSGQIASVSGDIRVVRNTVEKLLAAEADPRCSTFIYPEVDSDTSLRWISRKEREVIRAEAAYRRRRVLSVSVADISDLVKVAFDEGDLLRGALVSGVFWNSSPDADQSSPVSRTVELLGQSMSDRLYEELEKLLHAGHVECARSLLGQWATRHIEIGDYPCGAGRKLMQMLWSLPPRVRASIQGPLITSHLCIELGHLSAGDEMEDAAALISAMSSPSCQADTLPSLDDACGPRNDQHHQIAGLNDLLDAIRPTVIAREVGLPIDSARGSFMLSKAIADTKQEALHTVEAFYLHLLRHTGSVGAEVERQHVAHEAMDLFARVFAREGGVTAGYEEARTGSNGGLRHVLDRMTDGYKHEQRERRIAYIVEQAVGTLEWDERVAFVEAFIREYPHAVPPELAGSPPERFASDTALILRTFVESTERVREKFRAT